MNDKVNELTAFVRTLEKGDFYSDKLQQLTLAPGIWGRPPWEPWDEVELQRFAEHHRAYGRQLLAARDEITDTIVELLAYQAWPLR